jgi:hypothetical protein
MEGLKPFSPSSNISSAGTLKWRYFGPDTDRQQPTKMPFVFHVRTNGLEIIIPHSCIEVRLKLTDVSEEYFVVFFRIEAIKCNGNRLAKLLGLTRLVP